MILSPFAVAHEDRIIQVGPDGKLSGLPEKYLPSALISHYKIDDSGSRRLDSIELTISGRKTLIPSCVSALINSTRNDETFVASSWYHDTSRLPPYLNVTYLNPGSDISSPFNSGFSFLFDLDTGSLMEMKALVSGNDKHSMQYIPVDLAQLGPADELKAFYRPRK